MRNLHIICFLVILDVGTLVAQTSVTLTNQPAFWLKGNPLMQYNPEGQPSLIYDIPLPMTNGLPAGQIAPSFDPPGYFMMEHRVWYLNKNTGQHDIPPPVATYTFNVRGNPPPTLTWGVCEGNGLMPRTGLKWELFDSTGNAITPGGNWLANAQSYTNASGQFTLKVTSESPIDFGTRLGFVIDSGTLGKMTMGISIRNVLSTNFFTIQNPPPTINRVSVSTLRTRLNERTGKVEVFKKGIFTTRGFLNLDQKKRLNRRQLLRGYC